MTADSYSVYALTAYKLTKQQCCELYLLYIGKIMEKLKNRQI